MAPTTDARRPTIEQPLDGIAATVAAASLPLVGAGAALLGAAALGAPAVGCPVLAATGHPCPFCGLTRLAGWALDGRVTDVLRTDPAGVGLLAVLGVLAVTRAATLLGGGRSSRWSRSPVPAVVLAVLLVVHWATTLTTDALSTLAAGAPL